MKLKKLSVNDAAVLQEISVLTYKDTFDPYNSAENMAIYLEEAYNIPKLERELQNPESEFYFLFVDGRLAAYLKLNVGAAQSETIADNALEVERIYVKPEFKRRGLGKYLMEKSEAIAKELGKSSMWLGVWEDNKAAQSFYEQMGFAIVGSHSFFMADDEQTDLIMAKEI
nr:GNAT family N-acetyltransferase [Culicoidibacter larvae]